MGRHCPLPDDGRSRFGGSPRSIDLSTSRTGRCCRQNHRAKRFCTCETLKVYRIRNFHAPIRLVHTDPPCNIKVEPRSDNAIVAGWSSFQEASRHQKLDVERHPENAKPTGKTLRAKDRPLANDFVTDDKFDRPLDAWCRAVAMSRSFDQS